MEWNRNTKILTAILILGLIIRLLLSPFFADYNDFAFWTGIAFDITDGDGIYRGYDLWYPPLWGYVISTLTPLMDLFGITPLDSVIDGASSSGYRVGDGYIPEPAAVFLIKIPLILSDIACAYLVYSITKKLSEDEKKALIACALWTFCPLTISTTAIQGQFETVETMFILLALWSSLKGSYFETGAFITASVLTKPFSALAVLPLLAIVFTREKEPDRRFKGTSKFVTGGLMMTIFLVLPQLIYGESEFLLGFLTNRTSSYFPLPSDFSMMLSSNMLETEQSFTGTFAPSGSKVSTLFPLSLGLSIAISVFIVVRNGLSDKGAIVAVAAACCLHLIWYPATGYSQYYVPLIALLAICTSLDRRFVYAMAGITLFAMVTALWGFHHAYQLCELGLTDVDSLNNAYSVMRTILDIPDTISTHMKFLPVLAAVVLSATYIRGDLDES